ncbi:MAG: ABC transporter permease [Acidobacteria bacterium]|nr:ABC transporter permease [Acidobacteriota bacterium]
MLARVLRHAGLLALVLVLGGFLAATLVRLSPGFDADEGELDSRLSGPSQAALRQARKGEARLGVYYLDYWKGAVRGDLGRSRTFGRPVSELLRERGAVTLQLVSYGLLLAWGMALLAAFPAALARGPAADLLLSWTSGAILTLPAALLAFGFLYLGIPVYWCMAVVLYPRVFRFLRNLLLEARAMPHVLAARARGIREITVLGRHILPQVRPQAIALAGTSVALALAADVPVEVLSDVPGVGQLAWQAATGRDMPLLVSLTLVLAAVILLANAVSDVAVAHLERRRA